MIHFRKDTPHCRSGSPGLLQALWDGELPEARRAALTAHLEACDACAAALERISERDRRLVAARPTPPPLPPAASRALLERALAEAGVRRGHHGGNWLPLAWGFAAGFALLASGACLAWWTPLRPARDLHSGTPLAFVPRAQPGDAPSMTINSSPGPRMLEHGSPTPRVSPPQTHPHLAKPRPAKSDDRPMTAPVPAVPRLTTPHRKRSARHRFVAARPIAPRDSPTTHLTELAELPAPGTGEQVAMDSRFAQEMTLAVDRAEMSSAEGGRPRQRQVVSPSGQTTGAEEAMPGSEGTPAATNPSPPGPQAGTPPGSAEGEQAGTAPHPSALPTPCLLVLVASSPAYSPVTVTEAPVSTPSYARAIAMQPDALGHLTWTQATASDDGTGQKLALIMLGSNPW